MDSHERRARQLDRIPFTDKEPSVNDLIDGQYLDAMINGVLVRYVRRNRKLWKLTYTEA